MFVITMSKKRALRAALIVLAVFIGVAVGIAAVLTAINTGAEETKLPIYSVERSDNKLALSFNCAWGNSNTDELLKILKENNVRATFFVTGEFADKFPDDLRKIADAGHEIANHSDAHPHLKGMNINKIIEDTRESERKIMMITGEKPALYRAPYGEYDVNAVSTIEGLGYQFIQWSVDSIDWQEPDPATIIKRVVDKAEAGSILLFHNDLANTTEALPEILTRLKQAGFELVPVGELVYHEDYHIDHAGRQFQDVRAIIPVFGDNTIPDFPELENPYLNEAIAIIVTNLSLEEIESLRYGVSNELVARLMPLLSTEQLDALTELTPEQADALITAVLESESRDHEYIFDKDGDKDGYNYSEIDEHHEELNHEDELDFEFEKGDDGLGYSSGENPHEIAHQNGLPIDDEILEQLYGLAEQNGMTREEFEGVVNEIETPNETQAEGS